MTPSRFATYFHVHLVSDSTGETLNAMARAVCARSIAVRSSCVESRQNQPGILNRWHWHRPGVAGADGGGAYRASSIPLYFSGLRPGA